MAQVLIDAATMRLEKLDEETDRLEAGVDLEPRREAVESAKMRREHKAERLSTQLHERLDALGYRVGWSLAERCVFPLFFPAAR